jgi:opacity protein-like surface antigen
MKKLVFIAVFVMGFSVAAIAEDLPAYELFTGYSYFRFVPTGSSADLQGWNIALDFNKNPNVAVVADFTGNYGRFNDKFNRHDNRAVKVHSFLFGPKFTVPQGRYSPFIQTLVGVYHINRGGMTTRETENDFGCAFGFGLDIKASDKISVRPFEAEYVLVRSKGIRQSDMRVSSGVVFKIGNKY